MAKNSINIAIVGVGNCASSLVQGLAHYSHPSATRPIGLMHAVLGGYAPSGIKVVAAFDIDRRKVGRDVAEAIFAKPNCTTVFCHEVPATGAIVLQGPVLDGVAPHMAQHPEDRRFTPAAGPGLGKAEVVAALKAARAHVMLNYLPVGSQAATEFYAECALEAGVAFINNIPVFIASNPEWAARFAARGLPIIGDDIKSQLGATIVHRMLTDLFKNRGVKLQRTYQLNTGGNTDFLNMMDRSRLASKKTSKTEAVQSVAGERLANEDIHIGPSDYVAFQNDNKVAFIRMEGLLFGGVPMNLEMRMSVEDSPNSAGVAIDMIRCAKLALDRGQGGIVEGPSAYFCKHPPRQYTDDTARDMTEAFIQGVVEPQRCRA
ncbi:MAG: inositol-3-phosphate synthase [Pseudomonadota bacterium]